MKNFTLLVCLFFTSIKLFSQAGNLDSSFGTNGLSVSRIAGNSDDRFYDIDLQSDGKIIAVGTANAEDVGVGRYNTNGTLDSSFGINGFANTTIVGSQYNFNSALSFVILPDDKIIVADNASGFNDLDFLLIKYTKDGKPDSSFGTNAISSTQISTDVRDIILQPDGKLVVCGNNGFFNSILARFNSNGTLDNSFGTNGVATIKLAPNYYTDFFNLSLNSAGKIIVAGTGQFGQQINGLNIFLARYNNDGSTDSSFGKNGITVTGSKANTEEAVGLYVLANDKILLCANASSNDEPFRFDAGVLKYNADGSLDNSFGNKGFSRISFTDVFPTLNDITVQQDGKIIVAGVLVNASRSLVLARLQPNGQRDNSFGKNGIVVTHVRGTFSEANAVKLQSDGKILAAGDITSDHSPTPESFLIARYLPGENNLIANKKTNNVIKENMQSVIYPNPVKNYLQVSGLSIKEKVKLTIADFSGNEKASITVSANEYNWNVSQLKPGNYLLIIKADDANTISKQFIKE